MAKQNYFEKWNYRFLSVSVKNCLMIISLGLLYSHFHVYLGYFPCFACLCFYASNNLDIFAIKSLIKCQVLNTFQTLNEAFCDIIY
jgi:hypothetical protein